MSESRRITPWKGGFKHYLSTLRKIELSCRHQSSLTQLPFHNDFKFITRNSTYEGFGGGETW